MLTRMVLILVSFAIGVSAWADDGDSRKQPTLRELLQKARQLNPDARLPEHKTWQIADKTREALIFKPLKESPAAPVVFGFHGHGGNARNAARSFRMHELWPEALVVYMQGIPTPGPLTDPEGKRNGWQHNADEQDDRDFEFFDAVLASVRQDYKIDDNRIYSMGHSNGGGFTYLLWAHRPDVFAAVAPSAAATRAFQLLKPKPCLHVGSREDKLVKFEIQDRMMQWVRQVNGCKQEGSAWDKGCTLYPSEKGTPFVSFLHDGGHKYSAEAPPLIVKFFKEHAKKGQTP